MKHVIALTVALLLGACSNTSTYPSNGALIPGTQLRISPGFTLPLEKVVYWAGVAAIAYYVTDPLAPNWNIQEAAFPANHYRLSMSMKRYYTGGAGEARMVFNHRADELMRKGGFDSYEILDYSEGIESSVIGSKRVSEGTIALTRRNAVSPLDQGAAAPARNTVPIAENPAS